MLAYIHTAAAAEAVDAVATAVASAVAAGNGCGS